MPQSLYSIEQEPKFEEHAIPVAFGTDKGECSLMKIVPTLGGVSSLMLS